MEITELLKLSTFNILTSEKLPVVYIYAAKCACSTIKASLLGISTNPHKIAQEQLSSSAIDCEKPFFCITRNPYSRILSAYLDKICGNKDNRAWKAFRERYKLDTLSTPTFIDFLTLLANDEDQAEFNEHFRPQHLLNNHAFLSPRFIGRVERMEDVKNFLGEFDIKLVSFSPHSTNKSSKKHELSEAEAGLIKSIYAVDFEVYGYEPNRSSKFIPDSVIQDQAVGDPLKAYAETSQLKLRPEELFSLAIQNELEGKYSEALLLTKGALLRRPEQARYRNKLLELLKQADNGP
jgi:hypothetical protein